MTDGRHHGIARASMAQHQEGTKSTGWKSLFSFTTRSHWSVLVAAAVVAVGAGLLQPAMAILLGRFFDLFSQFATGAIDGHVLMDRALRVVGALLVVGCLTFLLKGNLLALWLVFGALQARSIRERLFDALLTAEVEWFELRTTGVGTLISRLHAQVQELQMGTSQPLGLAVMNLVQAVASLCLAFKTNWKLTLVVLSVIPVIITGVGALSRPIQAHLQAHVEKSTQAIKWAHNCITHIDTVKCCNAQALEVTRYRGAIKGAATSALRQSWFSALRVGFVRFVATAMFVQGMTRLPSGWKPLLTADVRILSGDTTPGKVVTTFWACLIAARSLEDVLPNALVLQRGCQASASLLRVLHKVASGQMERQRATVSPRFCKGDVEVRQVCFAYPSRPDHFVLDQCSMFFPAGEMTFLIGQSGSGKSTLGDLMVRFYRVVAGGVFVDGQDVNTLDTAWLRNNITLVQQTSTLFCDSVYNNIALASHQYGRVTASQMKECWDMADVGAVISQLPDGSDTRVGTGGTLLSGGQKQRIGLARARLRNAPIVILDEATSSLDQPSRVAVMEQVRWWRAGKTTVVITHDLGQIRADDFVYQLHHGRVVQSGLGADFSFVKGVTAHLAAENDEPDEPYQCRASWRRPASLHLTEKRVAMTRSRDRKDSFDDVLEAGSDKASDPAPGSGTNPRLTHRLTKFLSVSADMAVQQLKRRSEARAKATYLLTASPRPDQDAVPRARVSTSPKAKMPYCTVLESLTPRTPFFYKPLPVPPSVSEAAETTMDDSIGVEEHAPRDFSLLAIAATVWPTLGRADRARLVSGTLATLCQAAVPPAFAYALVQVFSTYYSPAAFDQKALVYSMAVLGIGAADGVASVAKDYLLDRVGLSWTGLLRIEAFNRIVQQPKSWFDLECHDPVAVATALDRDATAVKDLVGRFGGQLLVLAVMVGMGTIWAVATCWKLSLVALAASPALGLCFKSADLVSSRGESRTRAVQGDLEKIFGETFGHVKTVRALTLESHFHRRYRDATSQLFSLEVRKAVVGGLCLGLSDSALVFFVPLLFWYGARLAQDGVWPVHTILTVFSLLLFCTASGSAVLMNVPHLASATAAAQRLLRFCRMSAVSHESAGVVRLDEGPWEHSGGPIHFINLSFSYPTRPSVTAIPRLNLTIPRGKCVAIVGASGSGKSTLVSLLLGLYPPSPARVGERHGDASPGPPTLTVFGRDIRTVDVSTLRSVVAVVPQVPVILPGTVRENITYGVRCRPTGPLTTACQVESACRSAGIHEFVQSLPQAYATVIGEGGLGVSGGQAQRIAIARALVRRPTVLILDEATSALDGDNSETVWASITRLVRNRDVQMTVIVVTHAPEMMRLADHVVVLERGNVAEEGSFGQLMRQNGPLRAMLAAGAGQLSGPSARA